MEQKKNEKEKIGDKKASVSYYKNDFDWNGLSSLYDTLLSSKIEPKDSKKSTVSPIAPAESWDRFYSWHKDKFFKVTLTP